MPVVKMPNGDLVNFPDDMPSNQISAFIASHFPDDIKSHIKETAAAVKSGMGYTSQFFPVRKDVEGYHLAVPGVVSQAGEAIQSFMTPAGPPGSRELTAGAVAPASEIAALAAPGGGTTIPRLAVKSGAEEAAKATITKALRRDQLTPQQAAARTAEAQAIRPGVATVADIGGENVKGLVERVSQTPGEARSTTIPFLTERQSQQMSRLSDDLSSLTGTKKSAFEATQETIENRTRASDPAYTAAYNAGDRVIWGPTFERLSGAPEVQEAMGAAIRGWQRSQIAAGYGAMKPGAIVEGDLLKMLGGKVPVFPNLQFWDYTKGALDKMVSDEIRPDGSMTRKGRELSIITKRLRDELKAQVPEYGSALDQWSGPSSYLKAIESGKSVLSSKTSPEEWTAEFNALSEADKQAQRIGVLSAIKAKMGDTATELSDMTRFLRSPNMRAKIAAIMPTPEAAQNWFKRLDFEVGSSRLVGGALKGSPTARRLAEQAEGQGIFEDLVLNAITAGTTKGILGSNLFENSFIRRLIMAGPKAVHARVTARKNEAIAKMLTSPDINRTLGGLERSLSARGPVSPLRMLGQSALQGYALQPNINK